MKPITNQIKNEGNRNNPGRSRETTKRFKKRTQMKVDEIKLESGCVDCSYNKHPRALQFDHVRGEKVENVSRMVLMALAWDRIEAEIEKCEVVCANCHAIRTDNRNHGQEYVASEHQGLEVMPHDTCQD